jgi:radical SAM superfamily enzyme YgiQ (UPF0313 family)
MRALLVRPPTRHLYGTAGPDLGLASLKTALARAGFTTMIYDGLKRRRERPPFAQVVADFSPDVIGYKAFSQDAPTAREMAAAAAGARPGVMQIIGGPFPTGAREQLFRYMGDCFRFALAGEGDRALPALLAAWRDGRDGDDTPGLIRRVNGEVRVNPQDFPDDLDALGLPDRTDMPPGHYEPDYAGAVYLPLMTTRGCPYACRYCAARLLNGRKVRRRSGERVAAEVAGLRAAWGIGEFNLVDDNFTLIKEHALDVCAALAARTPGVRWRCTNGVRLDSLDEETLQAMERAGCYEVYVGLETGSERVAAEMDRRTSLPTLIEKVKLIRRVTRFNILGFFMVGYPTEEAADLRQTISLALSLPLDMASFFYFKPHVGTPVWAELAAATAREFDWGAQFYERLDDFPRRLSPAAIRLRQKWAYLRFYARPRPLATLLRKIKSPANVWRLAKKIFAVAFDR